MRRDVAIATSLQQIFSLSEQYWDTPSVLEKTAWYFQRYAPPLPEWVTVIN